MIFIALGANLPSKHGTPVQTLRAAVSALAGRDVKIMATSRIWLTAPVPFDAAQDWYHNAVVAVDTNLNASELLDLLLDVEQEFGRVRDIKNAPRLLDLDLIAYHDEIIKDDDRLIVPHPRMHERLFVLNPLSDIVNNWTHPQTGQDLLQMIAACPADQQGQPMEAEGLI